MARKKRRTKPTAKKRREFLEELAKCGVVSQAAEALNLDRVKLYKIREADPEFAQAWQIALEQATDLLEQEARRRALEGWEEPVFYQGEETGYVRKFSDTLLIFLLKGNRPDKFKDRSSHELSGPDGGPIMTSSNVHVYMPDNGRGDRSED